MSTGNNQPRNHGEHGDYTKQPSRNQKKKAVHVHVHVYVDVGVDVDVNGSRHAEGISRRARIFSLVVRRILRRTLCPQWLILIFAAWCICGESKAAVTRYPERLLRLLDGREPFSTDSLNDRHELPLKPLRDSRRRFYGVGARVDLQPLGQKLLLLDTAARGLLLKNEAAPGGEVFRFPEWVRPGPGIQTGLLRILPKLSWRGLSLSPVIAELFPGSEFRWVDGILSTEVFARWVVRLDLRKNTMILIPGQTYVPQPELEWPCRLDLNWWIVEAAIGGKKARLLLDTGSDRTFLSRSWALQDPRFKRQEAGAWEISLNGEPPGMRSLLVSEDASVPTPAGVRLDGVLGYDLLRGLTIDLNYSARKVYLHPDKGAKGSRGKGAKGG